MLLALLVFTQQNYCYGTGIHLSIVQRINSGFLETAACTNAKFCLALMRERFSRSTWYTCTCKVCFMPACLSSAWCHLGHFEKFPILRFSQLPQHICSHLLKKIEALWNFNMWVNGKSYKICNKVGNGWKFGAWDFNGLLWFKILVMPGWLSSVWGNLVQVEKCSDFQNFTLPTDST